MIHIGSLQCLCLVVNLCVLIVSCGCFGYGIWLKVSDEHIWELSDLDMPLRDLFRAANMFIASGIICFVLALFGCFGAMRKMSGFLTVYIVVLGLMHIVELIAVILATTSSVEFNEELKHQLTENMADYGKNYDITWAIDGIHEEYKCCGVENWLDFETSFWWYHLATADMVVPNSCCVMDVLGYQPLNVAKCQKAAKDKNPPGEFLHTKGCFKLLIAWANTNEHQFIAFGMSLFLLQLIVWCGSIYLRIAIKKIEFEEE